MSFPFDSLIAEHRELGLVAGVLIGFAFGFVLERAGFGSANKLAAQFYFYDMTVFKVMFGAIVTAMLGLVALSGLGMVNLAELSNAAASPTFLWPMVVGGFALGMGFIISGYCPGTSFVAAASGKLDGAVTVVGVIGGTLAYSELQLVIEPFHVSSNFGHVYLYEVLHLPPAVLATLVAGMAVAAFLGAEKLERLLARKAAAPPSAPSGTSPGAPAAAAPVAAPATPEEHRGVRLRRVAFAAFAGMSVLSIITLALPSATSASSRREAEPIGPAALARRLLDEPWRVRVVDLRPLAECTAMRIPGSECLPAEQLEAARLASSPGGRELVLVSAREQAAVPEAAAGYPGRLLSLSGGFEAWKAYALEEQQLPPTAGQAALDELRFRGALRSALTGAAQPPPPPPPPTGTAAPKKKGGGGCQ